MKDNGGRRPEQILTDIYRTRDELERTLVAIEHRLTPGQLVDQGLDYLRHSGANEFVHNLGGAAKQNPLPVALLSIGLAWLMALGRQPARNDGSSTSTATLRERASGAMQSASESMSSLRERAGGGIDYLVHEQPLALGAIGLAIGAVLGAAAPRTRQEERLMGEASRELAEKAKELGSQQLDKAQRVQPQPQPQVQSQHPGPTAAGPDKKGAW